MIKSPFSKAPSTPGNEGIKDVTDPKQTTSVDTLEGQIGSLRIDAKKHPHFTDMSTGLFCAEHVHAKGKWIIYIRINGWPR